MEAHLNVNVSLPPLHHHRPPLLRSEEFVPVMPSRRYNLLKIKQLYQQRQKDQRQGRIKTESCLEPIVRAEKTHQ